MTPDLCTKIQQKSPGGGGYFQKNWVEVCDTRPETLTLFQTKICDFPYPISLLKPWSPARDKLLRHVHGWRNIKREKVLSPNDEEVASSKKRYPIQD